MKRWMPLLIVVIVAAIIVIVSIVKGRSPRSTGGGTDINKTVKIKTNVYIENSGSMDGYVNGNTEFKDALDHILVMLNNSYGTPSISFINDSICSTGLSSDISVFSGQLTPNAMHVGSTQSSNINKIFKLLLDRTDSNNVSVLISDCVYSIKGDSTQGLLARAKYLTQNAFMNAINKNKGDLSTIVLQCTSDFKGYYYDMSDKPLFYDGKRPYYIIFVGSIKNIADLYKKIELDKGNIDGLLNTYLVSTDNFLSNENNTSIITDEYDSDNVKRIKPKKKGLGIESLALDDDHRFSFGIGFDASKVFVDQLYLTDVKNYSVEPKGVRIKSIGKVDKQSSAYGDCSDFAMPYYILLESTGHPSEISISLNYTIPKWVYGSSTENDLGIVPDGNVTFGISYMIEGISEAYRIKSGSQSILSIKFNIDNYK